MIVPENKKETLYYKWLLRQIAIYDTLVEKSEFKIDQQIYNQCSHLLRQARDKYLEVEDE